MDIQILGMGCAHCKSTYALLEQVLAATGRTATLGKVEDMQAIAAHGVMRTPAVVIDGRVVHAGGVPRREQVEAWLAASA